jgi:hypothetical protein
MSMPSDFQSPIHRMISRALPGAALLLAGGLAVAACGSGSAGSSTTTTNATSTSSGASPSTTAPATGTNSLTSLLNGVSRSSSATFSATYLITEASTGKTETVTFAQSPPKSSVVTSNGSFFLDGTSITECQGSGSSATCTSLPSSLSSAFTGITNLFSPSVITNTLRGVQASVAANADGYEVSKSSGTYGGQASNCITVKGTSEPTPVTYCGSTSSGVLTYLNANGNTVTLQAYSASPPSSSFAPPAGATITTLPAGA